MARIVDNPNGRRMIRLSIEDVLAIVNHYQYQTQIFEPPEDYDALYQRLGQTSYYLPEEV